MQVLRIKSLVDYVKGYPKRQRVTIVKGKYYGRSGIVIKKYWFHCRRFYTVRINNGMGTRAYSYNYLIKRG